MTAVGANFENLYYILQGSVATRFKCGGIFNDYFIINFLESDSERILKIV